LEVAALDAELSRCILRSRSKPPQIPRTCTVGAGVMADDSNANVPFQGPSDNSREAAGGVKCGFVLDSGSSLGSVSHSRRLGFQSLVNFLGTLQGVLNVVADVLGSDYILKLGLMNQPRGLFARAAQNQRSLGPM